MSGNLTIKIAYHSYDVVCHIVTLFMAVAVGINT